MVIGIVVFMILAFILSSNLEGVESFIGGMLP